MGARRDHRAFAATGPGGARRSPRPTTARPGGHSGEGRALAADRLRLGSGGGREPANRHAARRAGLPHQPKHTDPCSAPGLRHCQPQPGTLHRHRQRGQAGCRRRRRPSGGGRPRRRSRSALAPTRRQAADDPSPRASADRRRDRSGRLLRRRCRPLPLPTLAPRPGTGTPAGAERLALRRRRRLPFRQDDRLRRVHGRRQRLWNPAGLGRRRR